MNKKEEERIIERAQDLVQRHANEGLKLAEFDCPECGHKTLAERGRMDIRKQPLEKPHFIILTPYGGSLFVDKEGYALESVESLLCFTCGNQFKEVETRKWVRVK